MQKVLQSNYHFFIIKRYGKKLSHGDSDSVDDSVGGGNISREIREESEGLFADDDIVDEILSEGTLENKGLSSDVREVGRSDSTGSNLSVDNVCLAASGIERSEVLFVSLDGGVDRGEDGERSGSGDLVGDSSGLKTGDEKVEVVVSLKIGLFLSNGNTVSSPDLSRSFKSSKNTDKCSSGSRGGSGRCGSNRGRCGGNRGSGNRGSGGRGGSSRGGGGSVTHLQVFLEGRGGRDTLAGILVNEGVGVTGISHTTSSESVEESSRDAHLLGRGEGGGTSDKGGNKGNFAL